MFALSTFLIGLLATAPCWQQNTVILQPDAVLLADGTLQEHVGVAIRDGRILEIGVSVQVSGLRVPLQGVLAPGMVDAFSGRGAERLLTEQSRQLTPQLRAADGLQLASPVWESLLARGVTAVHITPDPTNVLAGRGVLVSAAGESLEQRILLKDTALVGSLVQSAIHDDRVGPSSLAGGLELLEQAFATAKSDDFGPSLWMYLENAEGTRGVQDLAATKGLQVVPILMGEVGSYGGQFPQQIVGLPTMGLGAFARRAETWRRLAKQGTQVAFGTRAGNQAWDSLRTSAMAWSRLTGDAAGAWATVTFNPAKLLGMEKEIGSIQVGARADLVLWSAHPLDATAQVVSVMVGGQTVFRAPLGEAQP